ncbi:aldo/keto reductase [Micromonospora sp. CPCC 205371]|nr:aldo/keto reductase [Micromonospora sp. CPCC 205371]
MEHRRLGNSGLSVSVVGLGCNNFGRKLDLDGTREVVDAAIDAGITLFDTADIYGTPHGTSEEYLGAVLGRRRDDVIIATKFGMDMEGVNGRDFGARGSRRYIHRAVEASLRRLDTDHIDLYQMHEPDPATPIEETLAALDVAIGGLAAQPAVASVIAGATTAEQIRANVAAGQWRPSAEDLAELDEITRHSR